MREGYHMKAEHGNMLNPYLVLLSDAKLINYEKVDVRDLFCRNIENTDSKIS